MLPDWLSLDAKHSWHPYTQHGTDPEPLGVIAAQGAWLELADGRRLLDGISSWWACLHGHSHPRLVTALQEQAEQLDHVLFAGFSHEPAARLAAELVEFAGTKTPADSPRRLSRVFYSDNGSTAVETALKLAFLAQRRRGEANRTIFLALEGGFHGDTFGAMAVGDPTPFFQEFEPLLFEVLRIPADAQAMEHAFAAHPGQIAAFVCEPRVQGAAGMVLHSADFLRQARQCCDANGAFFVADEVMTGFGRTGTALACDTLQSDFLCLAKGLTGGMLPLAATLTTEEVFQAFYSEEDRTQAFFHGHTFTGNPLGCAVARASLQIFGEENTADKLNRIGQQILTGLADLQTDDRVNKLRQIGGIVALDVRSEDGGYHASVGDELRRACRSLPNVLLRPLGHVLYAMPPSCLTPEECQQVAAAMLEVLDKVTPALAS